MRHFADHQQPLLEDRLTGLPWSTTVRRQVAQIVRERDVHAVCIRLSGMAVLVDLLGYPSAMSVVSKVVTRLKRLVREDDLLVRHASAQFLIVTTRPLADVRQLAESVRREVASIAVAARGEMVPDAAVGIASAARVDTAPEAEAAVEALLVYAEGLAATGGEEEAATAPAEVSPDVLEGGMDLSGRPASGLGRIVLGSARLAVVGRVVTATVALLHGERSATGKVVTAAEEAQQFPAVAAATAQALTHLLPEGYGVALRRVERLPSPHGEMVSASVVLFTPSGEEELIGIGTLTDDLATCVARVVLRAVNRRIGPLLARDPSLAVG
jgi:GGDEF domain-containing protein